MAVTKVYVIINEKQYTKAEVILDIKEEGYTHDFCFGNAEEIELAVKKHHIYSCDEVWCFGKCEATEDYRLAKEMGKELWQMK